MSYPYVPADVRACERISLRDVVLQLVDEPLTSAQIHDRVLLEYGNCSRGRLDGMLRGLVLEGRLTSERSVYSPAGEP